MTRRPHGTSEPVLCHPGARVDHPDIPPKHHSSDRYIYGFLDLHTKLFIHIVHIYTNLFYIVYLYLCIYFILYIYVYSHIVFILDANLGTRAPGHRSPGTWSQGIFLFYFLFFWWEFIFFKAWMSLIFLMSHFQVSQDLDESFSSLSRLG